MGAKSISNALPLRLKMRSLLGKAKSIPTLQREKAAILTAAIANDRSNIFNTRKQTVDKIYSLLFYGVDWSQKVPNFGCVTHGRYI